MLYVVHDQYRGRLALFKVFHALRRTVERILVMEKPGDFSPGFFVPMLVPKGLFSEEQVLPSPAVHCVARQMKFCKFTNHLNIKITSFLSLMVANLPPYHRQIFCGVSIVLVRMNSIKCNYLYN